MNQLAVIEPVSPSLPLPRLVEAGGERVKIRFLEFFAASIRNRHTRRAYSRAVTDFLAWCASVGVTSLTAVQPLHVATWIEQQAQEHAAPTAKQRLAGVRHFSDWMVTGQIIPHNPAASVRGPKHSTKRGKATVLAPDEARGLLDSIDVSTPIGLRDRALIAVMVYAFARIGAVTTMKVEDAFTQGRRLAATRVKHPQASAPTLRHAGAQSTGYSRRSDFIDTKKAPGRGWP